MGPPGVGEAATVGIGVAVGTRVAVANTAAVAPVAGAVVPLIAAVLVIGGACGGIKNWPMSFASAWVISSSLTLTPSAATPCSLIWSVSHWATTPSSTGLVRIVCAWRLIVGLWFANCWVNC